MKRVTGLQLISLLCFLGALALGVLVLPKSAFLPRTAYGPILHEEESDFSRIRVRGSDSKRHLLFVTDSGVEQLQSTIDLENPGELQVAYTRALFASLLFKNPQERMLLIGLGGGGMVRFVEERFPEATIEAVEIDPAVVRIAGEYFQTTEKPGVILHAEDAFAFLQRKHNAFDAIYLDAFLRPSVDAEADGKTARLKTVAFLETMRDQLSEDGVLACNLISYRKTTPGDLESLREVFPVVRVIDVPRTGNLAVIASRRKKGLSREGLLERARSLEEVHDLPFTDFVKQMRE